MKSICFDLIIQQDWYEQLNEKRTQKILMLIDLNNISDLSPEHNIIKRICLFEKLKNFLLREVFEKILFIIENHTERITQILKDELIHDNYFLRIPKISYFLNQKEFCREEIDFGITNQVVFH